MTEKSNYAVLSSVKEMQKTFQETDERKPRELLKEVLRRANSKEKQEYEQISDRQIAIAKRVLAILEEYEELDAESERNKRPESTPVPDGKRVAAMSSGEFNEWIEQTRKESNESSAWRSKIMKIITEQVALIKETQDLLIEFCGLETDEKWLLLSIALRSQPNLMRYIESGNPK